jgi:hypothetical protein
MKIGRALRTGTYGLAAVAAAAVVCGTTTAASAAPSGITPLGCGSTAATVYNGAHIVASRSCSGETDYARAWTTKVVANGWSGAVYGTDGSVYYFCDWQTITVNNYTRELYLNATRPSRC